MKNKGFTLIEIITAVTIFTIVMTISLGSILGILDSNRKSRSLQSVMSNLNLAMETMSREMRYGKNYHCGSSGSITSPQNCPSGDTLMSFLSSDNTQITYRLNGTTVEKQVDSESFLSVTDAATVIDSLTFYTLGADISNTLQPRVVIKIKGHAGSGKNISDFSLQTMVSQRRLDI
ncbi:MAG: type II secretion system protein [Patescibacteria group bacterium]